MIALFKIKLSLRLQKLRDVIFYLALFIEIAIVIVDKSAVSNPWTSYFFRLTFALTFFCILLSSFSKKELLFLAFLLCIGALSYYFTGRNELIRYFVFFAALKEINIEKAMKFSFFTALSGCLIIFFLSAAGIFGDMVLSGPFGGRENALSVRYVFGFGHPNSMHAMFFSLSMQCMYSFREKLKLIHYGALFALNALFYLLTDTRTAFYLLTAFILLIMAAKYLKKEKITLVFTVITVVFSIVFSIWAAAKSHECWDTEKLVDKVDRFLNGRIVSLYYGTMAHEGALETWSLFSSPEAKSYFDMGFVRLFYWYGIIPAIVVIAILALVVLKCYRKLDLTALLLISALCVYTIIEAHLVSVYIGRNYLLILAGYLWQKESALKESDEA